MSVGPPGVPTEMEFEQPHQLSLVSYNYEQVQRFTYNYTTKSARYALEDGSGTLTASLKCKVLQEK